MTAAVAWYHRQGGKTAAQSFRDAIALALRRVEPNPLIGKPLYGGFRACRLIRFPYVIVYRPVPGGLRISAIAHEHRSPDYWRRG